MYSKLFILSAFVLLVSCGSTKTLTKTNISINTSNDLISKVQMAQPNFTTANMSKVSISVKFNNKETTVSASCKIRRDSVIYLSIQPFLGIELFKAELMPDSVRVFDKMNGRLFVSSYDFFSNNLGVNFDFKSFQAVLTNQLFSIGKNDFTSALSSSTATGQQIEFQNNMIKQTTAFSDSYNILKVLMKDENTKNQLTINYAAFSSSSGVNFPKEINILAKNENKTATCNFLIEKVEFNSPIRFIPTNAHRFVRSDISKFIQQ